MGLGCRIEIVGSWNVLLHHINEWVISIVTLFAFDRILRFSPQFFYTMIFLTYVFVLLYAQSHIDFFLVFLIPINGPLARHGVCMI